MMHQSMYHHSQGNSFSMVFGHGQYRAAGYDHEDEEEMYSFTTSSPSSSVDCTLSLGTPSTRLTNDVGTNIHHHQEKKRSSCGISNFGWNILPSSKHASPPSASKSNRAAGSNNADPLLARRCANCDTTSTPLWRNGPRGPKSLCNACGIRFKKEERRATAAAAASTAGGADTQQMMNTSNWVQAQRMGCYSSAYGNEFRFMEEDDNDHQYHRDSSDSAAVPFLSWRFNVADRPAGLVHDFTR